MVLHRPTLSKRQIARFTEEIRDTGFRRKILRTSLRRDSEPGLATTLPIATQAADA